MNRVTAMLADIRLVMNTNTPVRELNRSRRKAVEPATVEFALARSAFLSRATPAAWTHLLVASRRCHRALATMRKTDRLRVHTQFIHRDTKGISR